MRSATELKQIFQVGWNIPARIENYVRNVNEFTEGETHIAWRNAMEDIHTVPTDAIQYARRRLPSKYSKQLHSPSGMFILVGI